MRNVPIDALDHLPVDVLPVGTGYPPDHLLARHEHRRAQLLYGASGVMQVVTDEGSWTVPADRAVLIPPRTGHEVLMQDVTTWSLYIEPDAVPWWPGACTVVEVGSLLRELLREANSFEADYDPAGRDGAVIRLILHELQYVAPAPFSISLPREEPFRSLCRAYLAAPDAGVTNTAWAQRVPMSTRSFERRFHELTGLSPATWRSRARLLASLRYLPGASVTEVAARLGYASPAGFSAAFSRAFGGPPSRFS
ncbi:helix-turn-helix transcriptional regulator [Microbacterium sp.]|uniref:AraC family transcriptional regulator n=1 Tax=Microbacterium sp. TaxID=51671 RepID=UPI00333F0CF4